MAGGSAGWPGKASGGPGDRSSWPVVLDYAYPGSTAGPNAGKLVIHYPKPLKCSSNKGFSAMHTTATGTTQVIAWGYTKAD